MVNLDVEVVDRPIGISFVLGSADVIAIDSHKTVVVGAGALATPDDAPGVPLQAPATGFPRVRME